MGPPADARPLADLAAALWRFGREARRPPDALLRAARRTLDRLAAPRRQWEDQVRRSQERVAVSQDALAASRGSAYTDPQTGTAYVPNPRAYEAALADAQGRLRAAEAGARAAGEGARAVRQAAADYQREAQRLAEWVEADLPGAVALLGVSTDPPRESSGPPAMAVAWRSPDARLDAAWATLSRRWAGEREWWDAPPRERFEAEHWAPLERQVGATQLARQRLKQALRQAERGAR